MCEAWTLKCIGDQPCHLMCDRTSSCQGDKYICPQGYNCIAHCTETSTCQGTTFRGNWQAICSGMSSCQGSTGFTRTSYQIGKRINSRIGVEGINMTRLYYPLSIRV